MNIEQFLTDKVAAAVSTLYGNAGAPLQIQKTRKEFEGDYTLVVFPLLKASRKSPEATATEIGGYMTANVPEIKSFNVIKGFLNLVLDGAFWAARFDELAADADFGQAPATGPNGDGRIFVAQSNKPPAPGAYPQQPAGLLPWRRYSRPTGHSVIRHLVNDAASISASRCWRGNSTATVKRPPRRA